MPVWTVADAAELKNVQRAAAELVTTICPILAGHHPGAQGMALAELVAMVIAGHRPDARAELLAAHVTLVEGLTPQHAADLWGNRPETEGHA
jgi:hypothetical protein